jgi:hypothetical protein
MRPEDVRRFVRDARASWPDARVRSVAGGIYNSVGLVFGSRRTWIETDYLDLILREDGYRRVPGEHEAEVGDVLVYEFAGAISHIAIVVAISPILETGTRTVSWVLSKWGRAAEYLHPPAHVPPFLGQPNGYWTEREVLR